MISERLERLEREEDNLRVTIEKKDEIIGEHTKILDSLNSLRDRKVILNPEREKRENIGM